METGRRWKILVGRNKKINNCVQLRTFFVAQFDYSLLSHWRTQSYIAHGRLLIRSGWQPFLPHLRISYPPQVIQLENSTILFCLPVLSSYIFPYEYVYGQLSGGKQNNVVSLHLVYFVRVLNVGLLFKNNCFVFLDEHAILCMHTHRLSQHAPLYITPFADQVFNGITVIAVNNVLRDNRAFVQAIRDLFFRAEDGIRAATVTGVQTCALPI